PPDTQVSTRGGVGSSLLRSPRLADRNRCGSPGDKTCPDQAAPSEGLAQHRSTLSIGFISLLLCLGLCALNAIEMQRPPRERPLHRFRHNQSWLIVSRISVATPASEVIVSTPARPLTISLSSVGSAPVIATEAARPPTSTAPALAAMWMVSAAAVPLTVTVSG